MSFSDPVVLYQAPKKEGEEIAPAMSDYDNETLILLFHMLGFQPQRVITEGGRLLVFFLDTDCAPVKSKIYAAQEIPLNYSVFLRTRAWWKDMISMAKETRRARLNGDR